MGSKILVKALPSHYLTLTPTYALLIAQILAEFNRIMEKDATTEFHDIWLTTIPKVFEVALNETTSLHVQSLLKDVGPHPTDGELCGLG